MKTITVELNSREITLLRCGLLRRMDNLKDREDVRDSYEQSKVLLQKLWDARKPLEGSD